MEALSVKPGGRYLDGTMGGGGHTAELLRRSGPAGRVLGLDRDPSAVARAEKRFGGEGSRFEAVCANFREMEHIARDHGLAPLDGIILRQRFADYLRS